MFYYNKDRETETTGIITAMRELASGEFEVTLSKDGKSWRIYFLIPGAWSRFGYDHCGWKIEETSDDFWGMLNEYYWDNYMLGRV